MAFATYIAYDLVVEILVRLPVKSIIRFKSVSRQWKSWIESKSFVERHMKNSSTKILLLALGGDGGSPSLSLVEEQDMYYISNCDASRISLTCDGLICIPGSDNIQVCNPATREYRRYPVGKPLPFPKTLTGKRIPMELILHNSNLKRLVPEFPSTNSFGFGKDVVTGAYKVVELRGTSVSLLSEDCNVLDLDSGQWRQQVSSFAPYRIFGKERSVYLNGSVHWFTVDRWEPDNNASKIVAFDLHTEEFRAISFPHVSDVNPPYLSELLSFRNRLSVTEMRTSPCARLDIWSMLNVEQETWAKMHSLCLCLLYDPANFQPFTPLAVSEEEDVMVWNYQHTLFKRRSYNIIRQKVITHARVVTSSYIPTLVRLP